MADLITDDRLREIATSDPLSWFADLCDAVRMLRAALDAARAERDAARAEVERLRDMLAKHKETDQ